MVGGGLVGRWLLQFTVSLRANVDSYVRRQLPPAKRAASEQMLHKLASKTGAANSHDDDDDVATIHSLLYLRNAFSRNL